MPRTIGAGIIGMGWMGMVHSRAYRQIPDHFRNSGIQPRLVACADDVEARPRKVAERFGFKRCTTDWMQVVVDPNIEVVNIDRRWTTGRARLCRSPGNKTASPVPPVFPGCL